MKLSALLLSSALVAAAGTAVATPAVEGNNTKPAPTKAAPKAAAAKARKPVAKTPPPRPPLPEASEDQIAASKQAYLGLYECEFKQSVTISPNLKHNGYIDVAFLKQVFTMKPVLSSTGALRLEDVTGRTLMVQIANKSMLLDVKAGQRMVDECIHPEQRAAIEAARAASAVPSGGLGIAPSGQ